MSAIKPWIKFSIAALFFLFKFMQMTMFNTLADPLMQDFQLSHSQVGYLAAVFFVTATALSIPAGWLVDKYSLRKIILIGMALSIMNVWLMQQSEQLTSLYIIRIMQGVIQSCCFIVVLKLGTFYFPARYMALASGLLVTLGMIGGIVAQEPLAFLVQQIGWRPALWWLAAAGSVIFILQFVAIDNVKVKPSTAAPMKASYLIAAFKNPQNWLAGLYTSMVNIPLMILGGLWGNQYLVNTHQMNELTASSICSMLFVGTLVGSPLMGYISDKMGRRCLPMIWSVIVTLGLLALVVMLPMLNSLMLHLLFLAIGIITSAQVIPYPLITESNPQVYAGSALSIASTLIMGGPLVFQPAFGWMVEHYSFTTAFLLLPAALILSLLCVALLRETYCKAYEVHH